MTSPYDFEIRPLSDALGAEIRGVDLSRELDERTVGQVFQAWLEYSVLLFRNQTLSAEDQVRFGSMFGVVERNRKPEEGDGNAPRVKYVANRLVDGKPGILPHGAMQFHSDHCAFESPYKATLLYAVEAPLHGGSTLFACAYKAYEALPDELKAEIEGLRALNVYDTDGDGTCKPKHNKPEDDRAVHPVVIVHPETRRRALYVSPMMTDHIVGLKREESDRLLGRLIGYAERPEFIYEHAWQVGDLVVWDNRCTLHGRTDFDSSEARILRRITVRGEPPTPANAANA